MLDSDVFIVVHVFNIMQRTILCFVYSSSYCVVFILVPVQSPTNCCLSHWPTLSSLQFHFPIDICWLQFAVSNKFQTVGAFWSDILTILVLFCVLCFVLFTAEFLVERTVILELTRFLLIYLFLINFSCDNYFLSFVCALLLIIVFVDVVFLCSAAASWLTGFTCYLFFVLLL